MVLNLNDTFECSDEPFGIKNDNGSFLKGLLHELFPCYFIFYFYIFN